MSWMKQDPADDRLDREDEEEQHDEEDQPPVISTSGNVPHDVHPVSMQDLMEGIEMPDETPLTAHAEEHPTPDRPAGRIAP